MTRAYPETYLDDAMNALGDMFDYAVHDCGLALADFYSYFLVSGVADAFGRGAPKYVAGMSGVELAGEVLLRTKGDRPQAQPSVNVDKSPEYWAGWILAYYQWHTALGFAELDRLGLTTDHLLAVHPTLHEADISKFVALADALLAGNAGKLPTKLQTYRKAAGLTQQALADAAGVSLRMVQLYEQRNKDINKAQVHTVAKIARALGCRAEDLLEHDAHMGLSDGQA